MRSTNIVLSVLGLLAATLAGGCGKSVDDQESTTSTLSNRLVAWWSFEEGGDSAYDLSGHGHHLTLRNATHPEGRNGKGLGLSGENSYAKTEFVNGLDLDTFTLVVFVKTNGSSAHQALISRESIDGMTSNYRLLLNGVEDGHPMYRQGHVSLDGQAGADFDYGNVKESKSKIDDGNWHLVVAMGAGKSTQIWIDGRRDTTDNAHTAFKADATAPLGIGISALDAGSYPFKGTLDEIRIYGRLLDPAEIQELLD